MGNGEFPPRRNTSIFAADDLWESYDSKAHCTVTGVRKKLTDAYKQVILETTQNTVNQLNQVKQQGHRDITNGNINVGYARVTPDYIEYRFNITLQYHKHHREKKVPKSNRQMSATQHFLRPVAKIQPVSEDRLYIILPLKGRQVTMTRFLANMGQTSSDENIELVIVLFKSPNNLVDYEYKESMENIKEFQSEHPNLTVTAYPIVGRFSRGIALETGIRLVPLNALIMFCDVDVLIKPGFFRSCRNNVQLGTSTYFPTLFSEYNPNYSFPADSEYLLKEHRGYWRNFGYGLVCLYKKDYFRIGGFDRKIKGWGIEDVDLYTKFVNNGYSVVRSKSPYLFHQYHHQNCSGLNDDQHVMCSNTMYSNFASKINLATRWQLGNGEAKQSKLKSQPKIDIPTKFGIWHEDGL